MGFKISEKAVVIYTRVSTSVDAKMQLAEQVAQMREYLTELRIDHRDALVLKDVGSPFDLGRRDFKE